ncbi:restriction endonuclease subunit S [Microbacterium sp. GXF7504]
MEAISEFGGTDTSRTRPTSDLLSGYSFVADGDVAYAKVTPCFENGKGLLARDLPNGYAFATTEISVLRPRHGLDARFLAWILQSGDFRSSGVSQMTGSGGLRRVPDSFAASFRVPAPRVEVQRAIADYLDRETAQIDAFIAKNEELIALLTERRAAVIADAATGGVRQEARLVDSGVDWIGSIPANWDVRPLRWSARIRTGTTPSGDMVFADEPGEPWIRPDDLDVSGAASVASRWLTPEGATQGRPAVPGATLVCTIGATLGKSGRIERASYFNQQITSVSWALNDEFLYWVFVAAREAVARLSVGNTLPILNNDKLATLRIPVPPVEEQGVIVDYIRAQTTRIDAAIQTAHRGVALARERRAALISAAVTGKIDVGVAV